MSRARTTRIGRRNAEFQVIESLKTTRSKRTKRGLIFVEGVAMINRLIEGGHQADAVLTAHGAALSDWARATIEAASPETHYELDPDLFSELSDRDDPSELIVVARRPQAGLPDPESRPRLSVVLDRPSSPGNLGSAIRSCDAFGVDAVIVTGHAADVWDPQAIRASLGAVFTTPVVLEPSAAALLSWISSVRRANPGISIVGTDSGGRSTIDDPHVRPPIVLVFGNEATGLSRTLREAVDEIVAIPMTGSVDSLNLAAAVSVGVYAVTRRAG